MNRGWRIRSGVWTVSGRSAMLNGAMPGQQRSRAGCPCDQRQIMLVLRRKGRIHRQERDVCATREYWFRRYEPEARSLKAGYSIRR